ncbi:FecCD family ABC transporter permease [Cohnella hongkongensis]|uniref:FecCD family ABC transporter permease n=1 Tax=Cohnella hongkongensis TaxID=178337 RepID=A0ABV9FI97_9BACL
MMTITGKRTLLLVWLGLGALNVLALLLQIVLGDFPIPAGEALGAVFGAGSERFELVVNRFRFPRALVAFLAGAGLALSGSILQGVTRNPLASPGVLGLNSGAALFAVGCMVLVPDFPVALLPFAAFAGALLAALLSYMLAWRRGLSPVRLVLVGVGISASAGAVVSFLLTFTDLAQAKQAVIWMSGSVYGRSWEHFWPLLPWLAVGVPAALLLSRGLDALQLGDSIATGLGTRLERIRALLLLLAVASAGAAVAMAGTIGFVGLMAPHLARFIVGSMSRRLIPVAVLTGGLLVNVADLLGRTVAAPLEIPCGILIALIGAPYMIYLLFRKRNS